MLRVRVNIKQPKFRMKVLILLILVVNVPTKYVMSKELIDTKHDIKKVLQPDTILSIKNPQFIHGSVAPLHPNEPVIGLSIKGDNRAYSVYLLNSHEIVNDVVGGQPVAVTW